MVHQPFKVIQVNGINVYDKSDDNLIDCVHWHSQLDIISIKFKCCDIYYPCFSCHEEESDHEHQVLPNSAFDEKAILCDCMREGVEHQCLHNLSCPHCEASLIQAVVIIIICILRLRICVILLPKYRS